jgi:predicted RNase H-like nuclease
MRVTGVDACKRGWVAVTLEASGPASSSADGTASPPAPDPGPAGARAYAVGGPALAAIRMHESLAGALDDLQGAPRIVGIDMPLGLLESGWRDADRLARGLLGPRQSSVFAIPPRAVWAEASYQAANQRCRELTGQGFSIQAWGLRAKLLEANEYLQTCRHPMYEVHPELAFGAMAGAPLLHSKHTAPGRALRREVLAAAGIILPAAASGAASASAPRTRAPRSSAPRPPGRRSSAPRPPARRAAVFPETDTLDAAAVAWSTWRIATGKAVVLPDHPQLDSRGRQITIRY